MPRHRTGSDELSISQLEAMLDSRRAKLAKLLRRRSSLEKRLAALDVKIAAHGGNSSGGGRHRGRAHNARSLPDTIAHVLSGGKLKVSELVKAILATGYKTTSDNFRSIVNQALIKDRKRFIAVERGVYSLKK